MSASAPATSAAHLLAVVAVELAEHLLGGLEVAGARAQLLRRLHDRLELAVAPGDLLVAALVGDQRGVAEARFEILVLPLEVSKPIQHRSEATASAAAVRMRSGYRPRRLHRRWDGGASDPPVAVDGDELGGRQQAGGEGLG